MSFFWEYIVYKILDISTLSQWDIISITSNFEYSYVLRCDELIQEHIRSGYDYEVATTTVHGEHGCKKMSNEPIYQIDNLQFKTCPCNYKHPLFNFISQASSIFEKGTMPFEGSFVDQPAYIIEAINLYQCLKQDYINEQERKQNQNKGT